MKTLQTFYNLESDRRIAGSQQVVRCVQCIGPDCLTQGSRTSCVAGVIREHQWGIRCLEEGLHQAQEDKEIVTYVTTTVTLGGGQF